MSRMVQTQNERGEWVDLMPLTDYIKQHPDEFFTLDNLIPIDAEPLGERNADGNIIIAEDITMQILDTGNNDVMILRTDGDGNEWWERER